MLDTTRTVETPEGINLDLQVVGPVPRALAWAVDIIIRTVIYVMLGVTLANLGLFGDGLYLLLIFLLEWFYPVFFEVYMRGATPGKRLLGLRVISDDGAPVGWSASTIRNLMRFIDFLPLGYGLGLLCVFLHRDFKRLGDLAAGTVVIYVEKLKAQTQVLADVPTAPPCPLNPEEQKTILDFAERLDRLTEDRADELARASGALVKDADNPTRQLLAIASWIAGSR